MSSEIPVALLIVAYEGRRFLGDCLQSVFDSDDQGIDPRIILVDNASTDASADFVREQFPDVHVVESDHNRGFAGGNNLGWNFVRERFPETRYLALLNQDTVVRSGWLAALIEPLEAEPRLGAVQSKLLLHGQGRINTVGNRCHFLGYTFTGGAGEPDDGRFDEPGPIDVASGAAMAVRCDLLDQVGLFDERFFLYCEDVELSWKLRQVGYEIGYEPRSVVEHVYEPTAPFRHYGLLERNRWELLLVHDRLATLLLLAPAIAVMEAGQWLFALRNGLLLQRCRAIGRLLREAGVIWRKRRAAQGRRTIGDREFLGDFSGRITFDAIDNPLLRWIGNPLLNAYWQVARRLIRW